MNTLLHTVIVTETRIGTTLRTGDGGGGGISIVFDRPAFSSLNKKKKKNDNLFACRTQDLSGARV